MSIGKALLGIIAFRLTSLADAKDARVAIFTSHDGDSASSVVERRAQQLCSCSPRSYSFRLDFASKCEDETIGDNAGVDGSICLFTRGGSPEDVGDVGFPGLKRHSYRLFEPKLGGGRRRLRMVSSGKWKRLERELLALHREHAANVQRERLAQMFDTTPLVVTSVTFLEFDSNKSVIINQDYYYYSSYFDTGLADGDVISYESVSAQLDANKALDEQLEFLPGGVMLVLFGVNKDNVMVQNTVAWGYNLEDCSGVPLDINDAIGWTSVEGYAPPFNGFCPAVIDTPTARPTAITPSPVAFISPSPRTHSPTTGSKSTKVLGKSKKGGGVDPKASKVFGKLENSDTKTSKKLEGASGSAKSSKVLGGKSKKGGDIFDAKAFKHSSKGVKGAESEESHSGKSAKSAKAAKKKGKGQYADIVPTPAAMMPPSTESPTVATVAVVPIPPVSMTRPPIASGTAISAPTVDDGTETQLCCFIHRHIS